MAQGRSSSSSSSSGRARLPHPQEVLQIDASSRDRRSPRRGSSGIVFSFLFDFFGNFQKIQKFWKLEKQLAADPRQEDEDLHQDVDRQGKEADRRKAVFPIFFLISFQRIIP